MRVFSLLTTLLLVMGMILPPGVPAQVNSDRITALTDDHGYFPCMDCHVDQETNLTPRILEEEHGEPMEWDDQDGVTHQVVFGDLISLGDLLGQGDHGSRRNADLVRIGTRLSIEQYMENNGLAPEDSVWTLVHGGGNLWCLDCHNTTDRDKLVKLNGESLTFNESHLLCGECHGPKLLDWDRGIHGQTTGYWDLARDENNGSIRKLCVDCHTPHSPAFAAMNPLAGPVPRLDPVGDKSPRATGGSGDHGEQESH